MTVSRFAVSQRRIRRPDAYWLLVAPALVLIAAFYLLPLLGILQLSVREFDGEGEASVLGNYALLFSDAGIQRMLWRTVRVCAITTVLTVGCGYVLAYAMVTVGTRQRALLLSAVLLTFWLSVLIRAFAWTILLGTGGPAETVVNALVRPFVALGAVDAPVRLIRTEAGVVIGMVHAMVPYAVLPLFANMRGIDRGLVLAARGLGATRWGAFRRVWMPLSMPGVIAALILIFVFSLGFYVTPALLGGGKVVMVAEYVRISLEQTLRWGLAAMLASTMLIATLALALLMGRVVDVRTMTGAK
ncbi:ABC transporter permease [Acuticoccus sediminis]|uniref:ABC transporter permease n=1 Tax=Acuticoccus sediminis TaxID=2184697 RepID=UPI001CFD3174|nr:ABC transporter permease [Acuticoccus sediminis]